MCVRVSMPECASGTSKRRRLARTLPNRLQEPIAEAAELLLYECAFEPTESCLSGRCAVNVSQLLKQSPPRASTNLVDGLRSKELLLVCLAQQLLLLLHPRLNRRLLIRRPRDARLGEERTEAHLI